MFQPKISGIIATDLNGNIANKKGRPILHGTMHEGLDRAVLREYLRSTSESSRAIFVSGENNAIQMGKLLQNYNSKSMLIKSSQEEVKVFSSSTMDYPSSVTECVQGSLFSKVMETAYAKRADVFVLGGRSVFNEFALHYSSLVHVKLKDMVEGASIPVNVYKRFIDSTMNVSLLHEEQKHNISVHMDTKHLSITEYAHDH